MVRAMSASEVIVHQKIDRKRILGVLHIDLEFLAASTNFWIREAIQTELCKYRKENRSSSTYSHIAKAIFGHTRYEPDLLAIWCETNASPLKCLKTRRHCYVRQIYQGFDF